MHKCINNETLVSTVFKNHIKYKPHGLYLEETRRNNDPGLNSDILGRSDHKMLDRAAICSSVSDVGKSMENRILSAPLSL